MSVPRGLNATAKAQAPVAREDHWSTDPEALVLLTLEVGREEPGVAGPLLDVIAQRELRIAVDHPESHGDRVMWLRSTAS